eukprot:8305-Pleurochrysis_carterae.AAC.1
MLLAMQGHVPERHLARCRLAPSQLVSLWNQLGIAESTCADANLPVHPFPLIHLSCHLHMQAIAAGILPCIGPETEFTSRARV